ncbi:hypothetical protein ART_1608 [Arthrobacter sp. PAMC 25486]|uniref:hypothetical protein n=1 Tax=Arthrobacter sp. PAMC 25486 TaxID=1494608 RepID=UPI000535F7A2|nr:hypothetical protein [Arthrobacter sp. PAMC 25486]AIY01207.1 hypothetical protein ART_1608 [Arthrobacter sp. PAMC 25486]
MSDETAAIEVAANETDVDWKAQARKWETRAKDNLVSAKSNEEAARRLNELEAEKLTETQRLQSQLDAATATSTETQRENARLKVIADEGIPKKYHGLVHGSTPEALAESAAAVKELIGSAQERPGNKVSYVNLDGDGSETLALNGDGIELALKNALGIS